MKHLLRNPSFNVLLGLALSCCLCIVLVICRVAATGSLMFLFLVWNLFLAFLPLVFSRLFLRADRMGRPYLTKFILGGFWLLFFPNALYIVTDFLHLKHSFGVPMWFDILILMAFSWTGLLMGFLSLYDIHNWIRQRLGKIKSWFLVSGLVFMSSFGVYLGRFVRWNSWDIFFHPSSIFHDVMERCVYPMEHTRTWAMTIGYGVFILAAYYIFHHLIAMRYPKVNEQAIGKE